MSKGKIALFTAVFAIVTFVIPLLLLMFFVSTDDIGIYFGVFGIVFFASLGFVCANIISVKKEVTKAISEIKVQNAAIAYRMAKNNNELPKEAEPVAEAPIDTSKVNLNPETPYEPIKVKSANIVDDDFDDFK